jgi:hypothetical protein
MSPKNPNFAAGFGPAVVQMQVMPDSFHSSNKQSQKFGRHDSKESFQRPMHQHSKSTVTVSKSSMVI